MTTTDNESIREALAEQPPQQDGPINNGWKISVSHGHSGYGVYAHMEDYPEEGAELIQPIEQPAQPQQGPDEEQEPAGVVIGFAEDGKAIVDHDGLEEGWVLYTSPHAGKPLTDEQWQVIADVLDCFILRHQKDAIEKAIGIKGDA